MTLPPIPAGDGEPSGVGGAGTAPAETAEGAVERRRAALERRSLDRRVRAVVEGMSDAFLALDEDWRVIYANREAARLNDVEPRELVGWDHWERWPETRGGDVESEYRRAMRDRVPVQLEHWYPAAGRWHEIRAFPMDDGGLAIFYRDITREKQLDAERARQARAVVDALGVAQTASDAKSQFLANTSHEIRTPLNAIIGYAELLEMGLAGELVPAQRQYVSRIQETSRHLLTLVNDVLDLSRVEAGQLRTVSERADLGDAVEAALRIMEPQARAREVQLANGCEAGSRVTYIGDSERVRQVLVNLLSNAVRFTPAGGRVTVTCGAAPDAPPDAEVTHAGAWTFVRVEDTGVGIAMRDRERMWEAFVQLDGGHTRKVGGSGLGLTISRHLARLMSGDITVRSEPGIGSTFTFWLPAASAVVADPPAAAPVASPQSAIDEMPRSRDSLAAAVATMQRHEPGLADVGEALLGESERVVASYVARLRNDERLPSARGLPDEALADHEVTLLADIAQCLSVVGTDGPDATTMLDDGTAIQRLIAARHGAQRARLGWSEAEVRRDCEIFQDVVLEAVRRRMTRSSAPELARASELITIFVRVAERHALRAWAEAQPGAPRQTAPDDAESAD
jgi:PAS domain S-box-containing protein